MDFLENIKRKPDDAKARYAFFAALFITLCIGGVWTSTLPARFAQIGEVTERGELDRNMPSQEDGSLFGTAKDQLGAIFEGVRMGDAGSTDTETAIDAVRAGDGAGETAPSLSPRSLETSSIDSISATPIDISNKEGAPVATEKDGADVSVPSTTESIGKPVRIEVLPTPPPKQILIEATPGTTTRP